jgi:spore germination protein GerM
VQPRRRTARIYYIRVTDDGTIYPFEVERIVSYVDSPMTQTLNALLKGPTPEELNLGLLNLIPENTQLISAAVEDGVAYLNFNESFRFNPMGVEGFVAQLQQIIYSTTEFPTVDRVQILIEGQRVEYLGGEGIYIGEPIGRNTFG